MAGFLLWLLLTAILAVGAWLLARPEAPQEFMRTIAFDNLYEATELRVHVRLDGRELWLPATCDPTTCMFRLSLTNARHTVSIAVEQRGVLGMPSVTAVDTRNMR